MGFRGQQQAGDRHMNSGDAEKTGPPGLGDGGMWVMKSRGALRGKSGLLAGAWGWSCPSGTQGTVGAKRKVNLALNTLTLTGL